MKNKFCIYSLPNTQQFTLVQHNPDSELAVFFESFNSNKQCTFHSDVLQILTCEEVLNLAVDFELYPAPNESFLSREEYIKTIQELQSAMRKTHTNKVVFSRMKNVEKAIHPFATLVNLRKQNPNAFCYLMHHSPEETWIGATPEILLTEEAQNYKTMSLAGTLPIDDNWTEKEIQEQQYVTQYIENQLIKNDFTFEISPLENLKQGNFKHLVQYFTIQKANQSFSKLVQELHPTPAVCGVPKELAMQLIQQFETYMRKWYTGFINVNTENGSKAYVNLRCAQVYADALWVYVGGGITLDSFPEKEWEETEMKSQAIVKALILN